MAHSPASLKVAVIAVHGVGSPPPDETARDVAELLVRSAPNGARYERFEEKRVMVPTARLDVGDSADLSRWRRFKRAFTSDAGDRTTLGQGDEVAMRPDIAFARRLLRDYASPGTPYGTVELVGQREPGAPGTPAATVHVFEMHWADLSRLSSGLFKFLGSMYQLVQHISHIGRKMVDVAAEVARAREALKLTAKDPGPHAGPAKPWGLYGWLNAWAIRTFTVLVPVATLLMLAFVPLFVPAAVAEGDRLVVGVILATLLVTVAGGLAIYFGPADEYSATFFVVFMLAMVTGAIALATGPEGDTAKRVGNVLLCASVGAIVLMAYLGAVWAYNKARSGAFGFGVGGLLLVLIVTMVSSQQLLARVSLADAESIRQFAFLGFQWSYAVLVQTWGILWAVVVVSVIVRTSLWSRLSGLERQRAGRVAWTSRATLASSVFAYIVVLLVAYRSAVYLAARAAGRFNIFPMVPDSGQLPLLNLPGAFPANFACRADATRMCAEEYIARLIGQSGTSGFVIALLGLALVAVLASWFIALIAATSVRTPDPRFGNSRRLGLWMMQGFVWMRAAGSVLASSMLLAILTGILVDYDPPFRDWLLPHLPHWLSSRMSTDWTTRMIDSMTVAVLASAATIGAARVRIQNLAAKARPALGIMLDVDNYLRETPEALTPRARIAERFISLLRYVESRGFDRVVLVAHSQGTVITTDLLRFLSLGGVPDADAKLVDPQRYRLLTMGSPLRQLYGANFPHLYAWVTATDPDPDMDRTELTEQQAPDISARSPDPAALRVSEWVNLYTSGDYVGRNLWCDDDWEAVWDRHATPITGGGRRERCLGAGTHTHYWTSDDAAAEIDRLIAS